LNTRDSITILFEIVTNRKSQCTATQQGRILYSVRTPLFRMEHNAQCNYRHNVETWFHDFCCWLFLLMSKILCSIN